MKFLLSTCFKLNVGSNVHMAPKTNFKYNFAAWNLS